MTAKEYLRHCGTLKMQMENKKRIYDNIRNSIVYLKGVSYDMEKIQVSPSDALSDTMARLIDAEKEAMDAIWTYEQYYQGCVDKINDLSKPEYVEILTRRYLRDDYKSRQLLHIALDMGYSYERAKHIHGEALQEFYKKYLKVSTF
jgi:hypothetical protein